MRTPEARLLALRVFTDNPCLEEDSHLHLPRLCVGRLKPHLHLAPLNFLSSRGVPSLYLRAHPWTPQLAVQGSMSTPWVRISLLKWEEWSGEPEIQLNQAPALEVLHSCPPPG